MFKIESYITPLLMGYVDKYVKLRPEDFQLSLWGGDAVLNNLDLRLDVIENAIQLPIIFKSGHIHELRIHVPWTKLGSEPVVITINTIECILKLRETAYDESRSRSSGLKTSKSFQARQKQRKQEADDLPPGYLQSLINKITNNVSFVINNLIVKFVEDDIVLSINVKSLECCSVDNLWNRAFADLSPPELALRKSLNVCDLTICLDKCDVSGKIENYQDPLVYRCSVNGRIYLKYDSVTSKFPSITKLDLFCNMLEVSLTDTQLPLFFRLIELFLALYYGTFEFPNPENEADSNTKSEEEQTTEEVKEKPEENQQGWTDWAWSYVPQILPSGEEESDQSQGSPKKKPPPAVLAVGMYAHKASLMFKLTEKIQEKVHYGPQKIVFRPFMFIEAEGIGMDIVMKGLTFFNVQFGISNISLETRGHCICGAIDGDDVRTKVILKGGDSLQNKMVNYYSKSLFDLGCPVNQGQNIIWIYDGPQHLQIHTEEAGMQKFGVFYIDYLYVMQPSDDNLHGESMSSLSESEEQVFEKEMSLMRYIVGSCQFSVSSSAIHRIQKFLHAANNHSYEPYAKTKEDGDDVKKVVRRAAVLPLVPLDCIEDVWFRALEERDEDNLAQVTEPFTDYVTEQWVNGDGLLWNHFGTDGPRTNNSLEGWHRKLKRMARLAHPNIFVVIQIFQRHPKFQINPEDPEGSWWNYSTTNQEVCDNQEETTDTEKRYQDGYRAYDVHVHRLRIRTSSFRQRHVFYMSLI